MSSYGKLYREDKWDGSGNAGQERCNKNSNTDAYANLSPIGPIPPKPTFDTHEEVMLILRLKIYDLITEHVPDKEQSLLLKKVVEYTFR